MDNLIKTQAEEYHYVIDDINKKQDRSNKVVKVAGQAEDVTVKSINKVVKHFTGYDFDDQVDEKEYKIEQDEINELFRLNQQNNGGICV